jgi:hypothetical protein
MFTGGEQLLATEPLLRDDVAFLAQANQVKDSLAYINAHSAEILPESLERYAFPEGTACAEAEEEDVAVSA